MTPKPSCALPCFLDTITSSALQIILRSFRSFSDRTVENDLRLVFGEIRETPPARSGLQSEYKCTGGRLRVLVTPQQRLGGRD